MAGKIVAWVYFVGYVLYVAAAALWAWPRLGFSDWWTFVAFQAGWYGPLWPIFVPLNLMGWR